MTYEQMMSIGEACGLTTVGECYDNVMHHYDSKQLYYYVKNAVNKAKETLVWVDDNGELVN